MYFDIILSVVSIFLSLIFGFFGIWFGKKGEEIRRKLWDWIQSNLNFFNWIQSILDFFKISSGVQRKHEKRKQKIQKLIDRINNFSSSPAKLIAYFANNFLFMIANLISLGILILNTWILIRNGGGSFWVLIPFIFILLSIAVVIFSLFSVFIESGETAVYLENPEKWLEKLLNEKEELEELLSAQATSSVQTVEPKPKD